MKRIRMIGLSAVVVGVMISGASADAAPVFSNAPLLRPEGGTEPAISIGGDGTMAITALNPTFPIEFSFSNLWKGPFGSTPAYEGPVDLGIEGSYGGADADVDIGSTGTVHVSTLVVVYNPQFRGTQLGISAITCPGGDTSNHYSHCTSQLVDTNGTDRPWISSDGRRVYLAYHDAGNSATIRVQRSDDDGITWKRVGDATAGLGQVTAGATFNNDAGPIVVDPRTHTVYTMFSSGTPQSKSKELVHNKIYVASSSDFGQHWTAHLVYQAPTATNFSEPFPGGLAVDPVTGRLFTAFSDAQRVFFARSADGAKTWSAPPAVLNGAPSQTALFPAAAAYDGTVDITYYGTSASSHNDPNAVWDVYLAKSSDSGAHFNQSTVTAEANHIGKVCTHGSACYRPDRTLADLFEIAIDPRSRLAAIAYASDTVGTPFRITSGPRQGTYRSAEAVFTKSILTLPGAVMKGVPTYVGLACPGEQVPHAVDDGDPNTQSIAVTGFGPAPFKCPVEDKARVALEAGYDASVMFNNAAGGETVYPMVQQNYRDIPVEMVGYGTGLAIFNGASESDLVLGQSGASISVGRLRVQAVLAQEAP